MKKAIIAMLDILLGWNRPMVLILVIILVAMLSSCVAPLQCPEGSSVTKSCPDCERWCAVNNAEGGQWHLNMDLLTGEPE